MRGPPGVDVDGRMVFPAPGTALRSDQALNIILELALEHEVGIVFRLDPLRVRKGPVRDH